MYQARQATGDRRPIPATFTPWSPTGFVRSGSCTCPRPASSPACTSSTARSRTSRRPESQALLASLGHGAPEPNAHDEAHLSAAEAGAHASFSVAEIHRWNPFVHLANLDLACYDREYASTDERAAAKAAHLSRWPDAIDGAIESLDSVPAPVAAALLPAIRGLGEGLGAVTADAADLDRGRTCLERLIAHLEDAAANGSPDASLGPHKLARLLGDPEAMTVDLGRLEEVADARKGPPD